MIRGVIMGKKFDFFFFVYNLVFLGKPPQQFRNRSKVTKIGEVKRIHYITIK